MESTLDNTVVTTTETTPGAGSAAPEDSQDKLASTLVQMIEEQLKGSSTAPASQETTEDSVAPLSKEAIQAIVAEQIAAAAKNSSETKPAPEQAKPENLQAEVQALRAQLAAGELRTAAVAELEKDGYPLGLADLIDFSSEDKAKSSLAKVKEVYAAGIEAALKEKLKGKTPAGLGGNKALGSSASTAAQRVSDLNTHRIIK